MDDPRELEQRRQLAQVLTVANISVGQLWLRYFGSGGTVGEYEVDAYVQGLMSLPALQRDILALSANELVDELPALPRAPMSDDIELHPGAAAGNGQDARRGAAAGNGSGRGTRHGGCGRSRSGSGDVGGVRGGRGVDHRRRGHSGGGTGSDGDEHGLQDEE